MQIKSYQREHSRCERRIARCKERLAACKRSVRERLLPVSRTTAALRETMVVWRGFEQQAFYVNKGR